MSCTPEPALQLSDTGQWTPFFIAVNIDHNVDPKY